MQWQEAAHRKGRKWYLVALTINILIHKEDHQNLQTDICTAWGLSYFFANTMQKIVTARTGGEKQTKKQSKQTKSNQRKKPQHFLGFSCYFFPVFKFIYLSALKIKGTFQKKNGCESGGAGGRGRKSLHKMVENSLNCSDAQVVHSKMDLLLGSNRLFFLCGGRSEWQIYFHNTGAKSCHPYSGWAVPYFGKPACWKQFKNSRQRLVACLFSHVLNASTHFSRMLVE